MVWQGCIKVWLILCASLNVRLEKDKNLSFDFLPMMNVRFDSLGNLSFTRMHTPLAHPLG